MLQNKSDRVQHGNSKSVSYELDNNQLHKKPHTMKGMTSKARGSECHLTTHVFFFCNLKLLFSTKAKPCLKNTSKSKK